MRINAGLYKRHNINQCNLETTRETSDMVRQAIYNLLGQYFDGEVILDLFAGSGAMGLEGISRGCKKCYFNDINKMALKVAMNNAKMLKIDSSMLEFTNLDYKDAILNYPKNLFDIIILDPPYKMNHIDEILELIYKSEILKENGVISFEMAKDTTDFESKYYKVITNRCYGIKRVVIYKR